MNIKFRFLSCWLAAVAVLSFGTETLADDAFTIRDSNVDGVLSGREAKGLKELDRDGDGEISEAEFRNAIASWRVKLAEADDSNFKIMDRNEDGRLSGSETASYEFCDLNSDGRITRKEFDEGLAQRRMLFAALPADQLQQSADEYFRILDANEDGRISGTEATGLTRFDTNADGRISKEECSHGTLMDALSASGPDAPNPVPGSTPGSMPAKADNPIQMLADAANSQDAVTLIANLRPELAKIIDEVILQYVVQFIHKHHGRIEPVAKSDVQSKPGENPLEINWSASTQCERGTLGLTATTYDGKLLGLKFDSPTIVELDSEIYRDLIGSIGKENGLAKRFAEFYSPTCRQLITSVLEDKDDEAIKMFHPLIREQIGREAFANVFEIIRNNCGTEYEIELETFAVEEDKDGDHLIKIGHRVTGAKSPQILKAGFQIIGMQAAMVSITIAPVDADDETPAPPSEVDSLPAPPSVKPPIPAPPRLD